MVEKKDWLLETGCPGMEVVFPDRSDKFGAILIKYAETGDLSQDAPALARKVDEVQPHQLQTKAMYNVAKEACKSLFADPDGTITIPGNDEELAILLYDKIKPGNDLVRFNEKYGKKTPRAIVLREQEAQRAKEASAMKRLDSEGKRVLGLI